MGCFPTSGACFHKFRKCSTKAQTVVKTPFGQCESFICSNVVRQGTVLGPVLNSCSLCRLLKESYPYYYGKAEIKSLEFVDDIVDVIDQHLSALLNNKIIQMYRTKRDLLSQQRSVKC